LFEFDSMRVENITQSQQILPEWTQQQAVLITWPHPNSDWRNKLTQVNECYVELAKQISARQPLIVITHDSRHQDEVICLMELGGCNMKNCHFFCLPTNDTWIRDYGPISVRDSSGLQLLNFRFNGWGNKFPAELDNSLNGRLTRSDSCRGLVEYNNFVDCDIILEGGSIDVDGKRSLMTTSRCLLHPERNVGMVKKRYEQYFLEQFGIKQVLWLDHGALIGDDTDGHVDMLARFVNEKTICYSEATKKDPQYAQLKQMAEQLQQFTDIDSRLYDLVPLPLPSPILDDDGSRLPASYCNFSMINDAVLVPIYDDPNDMLVLNIFNELYPKREVVGIPSRILIQQGGAVHCATMQIPAR